MAEDDNKPDNDDTDDDRDDNKPDDADDDKGDVDDKGSGRQSAKDGKADTDLGDAGKQAIDRMKRERNAARKELLDLQKKVKEFEDKDKTESQRLSEAADEAKTRAGKAETNFRKLQTAIDFAPEGATLPQIKAVAKRLTGDTDEEMEADAKELFDLLAPSTSSNGKTKAPPGKPRENLRGGGDPDEEPEEMDPRKLANLIGRP